jgi:predicted AAA+ superfamily ATPase
VPIEPTPRPRHLLSSVLEALTDTRVVLIVGPRQAGKSTLAAIAVSERQDARSVTLDDERVRAAAIEDPADFVRHEGTLLIDEIQRAPELLLTIKSTVDRSNRPGQYLLTGSANVLSIPRVADALPGRTEIIRLWPFSQGEREGRRDQFVDRAFAGWARDGRTSPLTKSDYLVRAATGGFPEVVTRVQEGRRARWFESYLETLVRRDIPDITGIERPEDLMRILTLLAARSANLYKAEEIARDAQMAPTTVKRYVALLEAAFIVMRVPSWANSRTTRAVRARKVYVTDSGLLSHLLGTTAAAAGEPGGMAGQILESFVAMELARQLGWSATRARLFHFRNRDGSEVDIILESADGRLVAVEVKASSIVRSNDFRAIRFLKERVGDRLQSGLVLYTGPETLSFGNGMWCAPLDSLWTSQTS